MDRVHRYKGSSKIQRPIMWKAGFDTGPRRPTKHSSMSWSVGGGKVLSDGKRGRAHGFICQEVIALKDNDMPKRGRSEPYIG